MDEETKKWLLEALEQGTEDEVKKMQKIVSKLLEKELGTEQDKENRLVLLEQLEEIIDGLDRAKDFCLTGQMEILLKYLINTQYSEIKLACLKIFTSSNQNNSAVQRFCSENGAFQLLTLLNCEQYEYSFLQLYRVDLKLKEGLISAVSALVRGEYLQNKRTFIDQNGLLIITNLIKQYPQSQRIREKCMNIIKDFLFYDNFLHFTYHDISRFTNTNGQIISDKQKKKQYLSYDSNEDLKRNNELPENKKYQNIVKQILSELGYLELDILNLLLNEKEIKFQESRIAYLEILSQLQNQTNNYNKQTLQKRLKQHLIEIKGNDIEEELVKQNLV